MKRILLIVLLLPLLFACGKTGQKALPESKEVTGVVVKEVRFEKVREYFEGVGTLRARIVSTVSARIMGEVASVKVTEGERVKAGQVLLTIDGREMGKKAAAARAGLREAEKALDAATEEKTLAEATYKRYKKLFDEKALSRQELDVVTARMKTSVAGRARAEAAVKRAGAGLEEALVYLGYTEAASPITGVVTEKFVEVGDTAAPGGALLKVEDTGSFTLDLHAGERFLGRLKKGQKVEVVIGPDSGSTARRIESSIAVLSPSVDPKSRTFLVKVPIEGKGAEVGTGAYARARVVVGEREALLLPQGAVVKRGQLTGVYAVGEDNVLSFRLIRTGQSYGDNVEVVSGLSSGDRVVVEGTENAFEGGVVKAAEKNR